jgi:hypothetical protein
MLFLICFSAVEVYLMVPDKGACLSINELVIRDNGFETEQHREIFNLRFGSPVTITSLSFRVPRSPHSRRTADPCFSYLTYEDIVKRGYFSGVIGRVILVTIEIGVAVQKGV